MESMDKMDVRVFGTGISASFYWFSEALLIPFSRRLIQLDFGKMYINYMFRWNVLVLCSIDGRSLFLR